MMVVLVVVEVNWCRDRWKYNRPSEVSSVGLIYSTIQQHNITLQNARSSTHCGAQWVSRPLYFKGIN